MLAALFAAFLATLTRSTNCLFITTCTNSGNVCYGYPSTPNVIIERVGYAIGYDNYCVQARWVSYRLTRDKVLSRVAKRSDFFASDELLGEHSATLLDYRRSGFDRGHLCPAADMAWSTNTMIESFLLSNMSPQTPGFNRGVWKDLEQWVRDQALAETNIFVYTGPVFSTNFMLRVIGANKIVVPDAYYKVILDETEPKKMIGFVLKNESTTNSFSVYATSVRNIEKLTELDFFSNMPRDEQDVLETTCDPHLWGL